MEKSITAISRRNSLSIVAIQKFKAIFIVKYLIVFGRPLRCSYREVSCQYVRRTPKLAIIVGRTESSHTQILASCNAYGICGHDETRMCGACFTRPIIATNLKAYQVIVPLQQMSLLSTATVQTAVLCTNAVIIFYHFSLCYQLKPTLYNNWFARSTSLSNYSHFSVNVSHFVTSLQNLNIEGLPFLFQASHIAAKLNHVQRA